MSLYRAGSLASPVNIAHLNTPSFLSAIVQCARLMSVLETELMGGGMICSDGICLYASAFCRLDVLDDRLLPW